MRQRRGWRAASPEGWTVHALFNYEYDIASCSSLLYLLGLYFWFAWIDERRGDPGKDKCNTCYYIHTHTSYSLFVHDRYERGEMEYMLD